MIKFSDTEKEAKVGNLAFFVLKDNTIHYGVIKEIDANGVFFGLSGRITPACKVYQHYPDSHITLVAYQPKIYQPKIFS